MIGSLNSSFSFNSYSLNISNKLRINNTNADNADNTNIQKNNQSIESKKSSLDSKEVLGYKVDKEGYFTKEFNKAAGIPEDYKIHSSTMQNLVAKETDGRKIFQEYKSIDIAKTIGNAYKIVSQLLEQSPKLALKESFSKEDLAEHFPQNYKIDKQSGKVKEVYSYKEVKNILANDGFKGVSSNESIAPSFFTKDDSVIPKPFDINIFNNGSFDVMLQKYTDKDGNITKGGLLVAVVNKVSYTMEGTTTIQGKGEGFDKSLSRQEADEIRRDFGVSMLVLYATGEEGSWLLGTDLETFKKKHSELMKSYQRKLDQWRKEDEEFEKNYKSPMQIMLEELDEAMKKNLKRIQKKKQEEKQQAKQIIKKLDINA